MATTITGNTIDVNTAVLNRLSTDGTIVDLQKDGTGVGSIQSRSGVVSTIVLDPRANGVGLSGTANAIIPTRETGAIIANEKDLGASGIEFRDLYLSGGVYLGGTGAANKLDDYEEGTWTPTYDSGFPSGSPEEVVQGAKYVKVGSLVHCILRLQARNDATNMQLGGLPFVANCDGGFGTIGHDSHTTKKERIFSGNSTINWIFSGTSSSLANQYYSITYTTDS